MTNSFPWGRLLAIGLLLVAVAVVTVLGLVWAALPLEHTTISIDGEKIALSGIDGWHAAAALAAAVVAVFVALIVAALVVAFAIAMAGLGVVVSVLATVAALALVVSPLLLICWLVWRLVRPAPGPGAAAA